MRNVLVVAASLLLSGLAAELTLRAFRPVEYRAPLPVPQPSDNTWRDLLHRPSSTPGLSYELTPSLEKRARGTMIRTNSHGMRDTESAPAKSEDLVRIAAIGDSFTFGFGVEGQETYPNLLEALLNASPPAPGVRYEVLNFGVGGYSTQDELAVLERKAFDFDPDLVTLGYVLNDPETDPAQPLHRHFYRPSWWEHSHFLRLLAKGKNDWESRGSGAEEDYIRKVNSHRGKWGKNQKALRAFQRLVRERGIELIVVIFPFPPKPSDWEQYQYADLHARVAAFTEGLGIPTIDLVRVYADYDPRAVLGANAHPTVLGHVLVAEELHELILSDPARFLPSRP